MSEVENSVVRMSNALTWIRDWYSSLSLCGHKSTSRGPAFVFSNGIDDRAFLVFSMVLKQFCTPMTLIYRNELLMSFRLFGIHWYLTQVLDLPRALGSLNWQRRAGQRDTTKCLLFF